MSLAGALATQLIVASDWKSRPLGETVEVLDSKRKPITKRDRVPGPYPYYGATGVLDYVEGYIFDEPLVLIGEDGAKWGAGDASAFPVQGKVWVNNHAHVLRPDRELLIDEWLIYYLNAADLSEFISGMTVPKLNQGRLKEIPIPLPPLEEQKRIVAVLDQAFAALDRARALAEANLADAEELFETALDLAFEDLKGHGNLPLSEFIEIAHGYAFKSKDFSNIEDEKLPIVLTPGNYAEDATLYFREGKTKRLNGTAPVDYLFAVGELTIVMTDLSSKMKILGKPAFIDRPGLLHNQRIGRIRFLDDRLLPRFLYYFMRTGKYLAEIRDSATGTMVRHTAPKRVLACDIPIPPMNIQEQVVDRLQRLEARCAKLRKRYENGANELGELRQALLHEAFGGELT